MNPQNYLSLINSKFLLFSQRLIFFLYFQNFDHLLFRNDNHENGFLFYDMLVIRENKTKLKMKLVEKRELKLMITKKKYLSFHVLKNTQDKFDKFHGLIRIKTAEKLMYIPYVNEQTHPF